MGGLEERKGVARSSLDEAFISASVSAEEEKPGTSNVLGVVMTGLFMHSLSFRQPRQSSSSPFCQ